MSIPYHLPLLIDIAAAGDHARGSAENAAACRRAGAQALCVPEARRGDAAAPARKARAGAGGIPVGSMLEPTGLFVPPLGECDFEGIYAVCREKIAAQREAEADFLLLDRQTALADMRAFLLAARGTGLPVFACMDLGPERADDAEDLFLPALITLQAMGAAAVGFRGVPCGELLRLAEEALPCAAVPFLFAADSDPEWTPAQFADAVRPFLELGVRIVGCGENTSALHLHALHELMKKYGPPEISGEAECRAAASEQEAFFLREDLEFSEPIRCSSQLEEDLIALEDEEVSAALVLVESIGDAELLGRFGSLARLPVAVHAVSATVLEAALRSFQGRLIIDSGSPVDREVLEPLAVKYGAIIY